MLLFVEDCRLLKSAVMPYDEGDDGSNSSDEEVEQSCFCSRTRVTVGDHVTTDIDGVSVEGRVVSVDNATKSCTIEPIVSTSGPENAAKPAAAKPAAAEPPAAEPPAVPAKDAKDAKSAEDAKDAKPAKDDASDGNNAYCWTTAIVWAVMKDPPPAEQDAAEGQEKKEGKAKKEGGNMKGNYNSPHMQVARAIMCG